MACCVGGVCIRDGYKIMLVIPKLDIMVWHCLPRYIYIYIEREITNREISYALYDYVSSLCLPKILAGWSASSCFNYITTK